MLSILCTHVFQMCNKGMSSAVFFITELRAAQSAATPITFISFPKRVSVFSKIALNTYVRNNDTLLKWLLAELEMNLVSGFGILCIWLDPCSRVPPGF